MEGISDEKMYYPSQEVIDQANVQNYEKLYEWSVENPELFWAEQAEHLSWYKKWDNVLNKSNPPQYVIVEYIVEKGEHIDTNVQIWKT